MFFFIVIVGIVIFVCAWVYTQKNLKDFKKSILSSCAEKGINLSQFYMSSKDYSGIAIDHSQKKICLIDGSAYNLVDFDYIISCELKENGEEIIKTSRTSQLAGAVIGGALFGGVGAVIGGLSGSKVKNAGKIKDLDLEIIINDTENPIHTVSFLDGLTEYKKNDDVYRDIYRTARRWYGILSVVVNQNKQTNN